jgi:hypothetical protein
MVERTAEFILGLIGGILGLLAVPGSFFLGGFIAAFGGPATLVGWAIVGGILSAVGLVGAAFVKSRPRPAAVMMLISGALGLFVALGFWVGALLLLVAGIIALIRREKPTESVPPPSPETVYYCTKCGKPLTYVPQYRRWYCENCRAYAPS